MAQPAEGPLHPRWGPFIRNVRELAPGLWLADATRGQTGRGRSIFQVLLRAHPKAGQPRDPQYPQWGVEPDFEEVGRFTKRSRYNVRGFGYNIGTWQSHERADGFSTDETKGYDMFVAVAKEIFR